MTSDSGLSSIFSRTSVIESTPWALIAYTSFIWWASAGEKKSGLGEDDEQQVGEDEQDRALLFSGHDEDEGGEGQEGRERFGGLSKETAIVGYFHRLTGLIFATVSDAISRVDGEGVRRGGGGGDYTKYTDDNENESAGRGESGKEAVQGLGLMSPSNEPTDIAAGKDAEREEGEDADPAVAAPSNGEGEDEPLLPQASSSKTPSLSSSLDEERPTALVEITSEDMAQMGLDVWSSADRSFVEELVLLWWGREAAVRGGRVECCGVRVL